MFDWVLNTLLDNANFLHADIQEKKKPEDVYIYIYLEFENIPRKVSRLNDLFIIFKKAKNETFRH